MKKTLLLACAVLIPFLIIAAPPIGQVPPVVDLQGEDGGRVDGTPWSSREIKDKVYVMFYVDPDEKDLNDHVSATLKKEDFPLDKYGSIAIINMDATWLPNGLIASSLKEKQEEFPSTIYVKDMEKILVKKWDIADDNSDILLFDRSGKVLFYVAGKLTDNQIQELIQLTRDNL
ncbi:MAG: transcriptional regulator [Proteobacteria bacterium]|nr:transcriptional regulator [Pseudomonadota bacterium]